MGCCNIKRPFGDDNVSELERSLALNQISVKQFQVTLKKKAGDKNISLAEVGEAFKSYSFGKQILSDEDTAIK